ERERGSRQGPPWLRGSLAVACGPGPASHIAGPALATAGRNWRQRQHGLAALCLLLPWVLSVAKEGRGCKETRSLGFRLQGSFRRAGGPLALPMTPHRCPSGDCRPTSPPDRPLRILQVVFTPVR